MDQIYYRPDIELRTIVGTPMALETALTKLRGPVGDEVTGKLDYTQMKGGFDFDYAVYDEVCMRAFGFLLFGEEGGGGCDIPRRGSGVAWARAVGLRTWEYDMCEKDAAFVDFRNRI